MNRDRRAVTNKVAALLVVLAMVLALASCSGGAGKGAPKDIDEAIKGASEYLVENVPVDTLDSMGGGWVPFALKCSGTDAAGDEYYEAYHDSVRATVKSNKGVLSEERPTAYERVSMNLAALGIDPKDVEGYDLMEKVDDYKLISEQGLNAEIYALISSNYVGYELKNEKKYFDDIISQQNDDGSFGMDADHPDVDMTAMAVQALSFYNGAEGKNTSKSVSVKDRNKAADFIEKALSWMASKQNDDGGYDSCEATAQVVIALGSLRMDPVKEEAFIKDGKTLYDGLISYWEGTAFYHADEENVDIEPDVLATEQALLALDQIKLSEEERSIFEK